MIRFGAFLQQIPVFLLPPGQLRNFGHKSYSRTSAVSFWTNHDFVSSGLTPGEAELLAHLPQTRGDLLLLGLGGGREAIPLAKEGFRVTGVDFVTEMVNGAVRNAASAGVNIRGEVQEITRLDFPSGSFDLVWFSCSIYSAIPGRKNRVEALTKTGDLLKPGGRVACFFYWNPHARHGRTRWKMGRFIARITGGNRRIEQGDILKDNLEFLHAFSDTAALEAEFHQSGFSVIRFIFPENSHNACALLQKKSESH